MNTISIVTPVYEPVAEYLTAAHDSLSSQDLPANWEWEWLIQEDGTSDIARTILRADSRIHIATGRKAGVAITRNLALARASGDLIRNLDQDDILTPGALRRDVEVMTANPDVGWTTSRVLDLLPDGSTLGFDDDPPHSRLEPGYVVNHWRNHDFRLPVHPTTICIRRELAEALGGWMSVPGSDDTGLLVAASVVSTGYFVKEVGLLYRKWPGQASASPDHTDKTEWALRMNLISKRADALSRLVTTPRTA